MTSLNEKCPLVQLLVVVIVVTVNAEDVCVDTCRVIYEVDNQIYNKTYQNYHTMLSALPQNVVSLMLPERCRILELRQKELRHLSKVQRLWLRACDTTTNIYGSVFEGLYSLTELTLDFYHFYVNIKPEAFEPIQQLTTLKILPHSSEFVVEDDQTDVPTILCRLHNLQHFTLSTFYLASQFRVERNYNCQLSSIQSLDFSNNHWTDMPHLPQFPNLRYLNLSGNIIDRPELFSESSFQTKNITINLSNNMIQTLKKDDFKNYNNVEYLSLDLSETPLLKIYYDIFDYLRQRNTTIEILTIGRNEGAEYERHFFNKLFKQLRYVKIHKLVLSGKKVVLNTNGPKYPNFPMSETMTHFSLTHGMIWSFPHFGKVQGYNLEFLDLSYNKIGRIARHGLSGIKKVKTLILTGVKLPRQPSMHFVFESLNGMTQLNKLLLNKMGTWLFKESTLALTKLANLQYLDLSDNTYRTNVKVVAKEAKILKVNNITCNCKRFPCINLEQISQVETLEMRNSLRCVSPFTYQTVYTKLLNLDVSQNANVSLDVSPLVDIQMPQLKFLRLSHNNIKQLSNKTFAKVLELQFIDLSFNKLATISRHIFSKLIFLQNLKLNNNLISTIYAQNFKGLAYLASVSLYQNRFDCNCELRQLRDWIQANGLSEDMLDTCKYPTYLKHTSIAKFRLNWIDCDGHIYIVITTTAAGFILLIIALLALTYCRLDIKYWYFFKYKYRNREAMENDMYDAMVCYHIDDLVWVKDNLMPQLEEGNEHQFRLCVHHRDFDVGEFIKQNIINSMNRSRSIIFVMTRKFMNSEWGQFELEMALMRLPEVKCQFVVMVMLEKIPKKQLKAKLRCFTRHLTYIEWPLGDDVEQWERDHFWKKFMLALMYNKQAKVEDENIPPFQLQ